MKNVKIKQFFIKKVKKVQLTVSTFGILDGSAKGEGSGEKNQHSNKLFSFLLKIMITLIKK